MCVVPFCSTGSKEEPAAKRRLPFANNGLRWRRTYTHLCIWRKKYDGLSIVLGHCSVNRFSWRLKFDVRTHEILQHYGAVISGRRLNRCEILVTLVIAMALEEAIRYIESPSPRGDTFSHLVTRRKTRWSVIALWWRISVGNNGLLQESPSLE